MKIKLAEYPKGTYFNEVKEVNWNPGQPGSWPQYIMYRNRLYVQSKSFFGDPTTDYYLSDYTVLS